MAEKNFREIEAEIAEKGFAAICKDSLAEMQNTTRMLAYLEESFPELKGLTFAATGHLLRASVSIMDLLKMMEG